MGLISPFRATKCQHCNSWQTRARNTYYMEEEAGTLVIRERNCLDCGKKFWTQQPIETYIERHEFKMAIKYTEPYFRKNVTRTSHDETYA
jgi:transcriptional regulator NrdR family protein